MSLDIHIDNNLDSFYSTVITYYRYIKIRIIVINIKETIRSLSLTEILEE